jgi:hypothetical protein
MDLGGSKQHEEETAAEPRVWVMPLRCNEPGRPLRKPQSIGSALMSILSDPEIEVAMPMIPGKSVRDLNFSDDISVIKAQNGFILTLTVAQARMLQEDDKIRKGR